MATLLAQLAALFCLAAPFTSVGPVQDAIPALEPEDVVAVLLFEIEGLAEGDVVVERVGQLYDRGRATVVIRGRRMVLLLRCRLSDFGPHWGLQGTLDNSLYAEPPAEAEPPLEALPALEAEAPPAAETAESADDVFIPDAEDTHDYQLFLTEFMAALKEGAEESYAGFYYRESDFDAESPAAPTRAELESRRRSFVESCRRLSRDLARFETLTVVQVVARGIPQVQLDVGARLLPGLLEFYSPAVVEMQLDDRWGRIVLDGVARLGDGWRVGEVGELQFPGEGDAEPEPESEAP